MADRIVKFLADSIDEDLKTAVCTEDVVEKVEVDEYGLHLWRWSLLNNEEMHYIVPLTEENKMFKFID
jgi:hypothetical protein